MVTSKDITKYEDWYNITVEKVEQNRGAGLIKEYNRSLQQGRGQVYSFLLFVSIEGYLS
jgi:hypothetical protein